MLRAHGRLSGRIGEVERRTAALEYALRQQAEQLDRLSAVIEDLVAAVQSLRRRSGDEP